MSPHRSPKAVVNHLRALLRSIQTAQRSLCTGSLCKESLPLTPAQSQKNNSVCTNEANSYMQNETLRKMESYVNNTLSILLISLRCSEDF